MEQPSFDPGLTRQFSNPLRRAINKDGSFNVRRRGASWRAFHPWLMLVDMSWTGFAAVLGLLWLTVNTGFALIYFSIDPRELQGIDAATRGQRFLYDFFFSAQTLTTVGYGGMAPRGILGNFVASTEALIGLMAFAVGTGLLLARVSRPSARIAFSPHALMAPYQDGISLQFRVVNERRNNLIELEARVLLMTVVPCRNGPERRYDQLTLERKGVIFFPLTWTIVHPIDENSPLYGKTAADLEQSQAELLILIKGFDDTFSQVVNARYSYRYDEIVWGAKFAPAFRIDEAGDIVLDLALVGAITEPRQGAAA
ncbi:MAG TPA: ion channel [Bryobacteraceae bacterium]|nr:ion channel [Bryobacteraceae bacterium]